MGQACRKFTKFIRNPFTTLCDRCGNLIRKGDIVALEPARTLICTVCSGYVD
jgi:hypothetical protein